MQNMHNMQNPFTYEFTGLAIFCQHASLDLCAPVLPHSCYLILELLIGVH